MSLGHAVHSVVDAMENSTMPYELKIIYIIFIIAFVVLIIALWNIFKEKIKEYVVDARSRHKSNNDVNSISMTQSKNLPEQKVSNASSKGDVMQYCVYCGEKIPKDSNYCVKCGHKIPQNK